MNATTNFGSVTFQGKTITLTSQAEPTSRTFPGDYNSAQMGKEYTAEWNAWGVDEEGNRVEVIWQFTEVKGEEKEDAGDYDWDDVHSVRLA